MIGVDKPSVAQDVYVEHGFTFGINKACRKALSGSVSACV